MCVEWEEGWSRNYVCVEWEKGWSRNYVCVEWEEGWSRELCVCRVGERVVKGTRCV